MEFLKKKRKAIAPSLLVLLSAATVLVSGCGGGGSGSVTQTVTPGTYFGQTQPMGNGSVRSFVSVGSDGKPASLGVSFSENALTGLPSDLPPLQHGISTVIQFPSEAAQTPFNHIELRYWPEGHDPDGVLSLSHIDFVSFVISPQERDQITAQGENLAKVLKTPQDSYIPLGFAPIPSVDFAYAEARFGTRYFDVAKLTPVLSGTETFTTAVFYGYYNGQTNFIEIPITIPLLQSQSGITDTFAAPSSAAKAGYYPTRFRVQRNPVTNEQTFFLENFVYRN